MKSLVPLGGWILGFGDFSQAWKSHVEGMLYIPGSCERPLFWGERTLQKKAFSNENRGHLGSRYIYI